MTPAGQGHDTVKEERQIIVRREDRDGGQHSLVYCVCRAEVASLFFIKTQRLSAGLLQGLSDALPVNTANLIPFIYFFSPACR